VDRPLDILREIRRILAPNGIVVIFIIRQKSLMNRIGRWIYKSSFGQIISPLARLYDIHHNYFFDSSHYSTCSGKLGWENMWKSNGWMLVSKDDNPFPFHPLWRLAANAWMPCHTWSISGIGCSCWRARELLMASVTVAEHNKHALSRQKIS
jgi:hypothetical protein